VGAPVVATVWGPAEECAIGAFGRALAPLLDAPPPATTSASRTTSTRPAAGPPPLHHTGRLAKLVGLSGLEVERAEDVRCPFDYPDERSVLAELYATELGRRAVASAGRARVRRAVLGALASYRRPDGGYRLTNTFRLVVARAR
jgi:hypothetical protein